MTPALLALATALVPPAQAAPTVVSADAVQWEDLNPARGDQSPRAGTLWGDRKADVATGYLLRPVDGFSSPPHIHNVSYRAVVIRGELHNDDPGAAHSWMGPGSFWTQPAGEAHITAARGSDTLAYIEIDSGPYLVHPVEQATNNGERAVNLHPSHLVWLRAPGPSGAQLAHLWGEPEGPGASGSFVRWGAGSTVELRSQSGELRAVVTAGTPGVAGAKQSLEPSSLVREAAGAAVSLGCGPDDCMVYVTAAGGLVVGGE